MSDDITRLASNLPDSDPADPAVLRAAGQALGIEWPTDYVALVAAHNGVEGTSAPSGWS